MTRPVYRAEQEGQQEQQQQAPVRQETRAPERQLPRDLPQQPARLLAVGPRDARGQTARSDARRMQERATTAGRHVQQLAALQALVVVDVSAQEKRLPGGQVEPQGLDHRGAGRARRAELVEWIGQHGEDGRIGLRLMVIAQEALLPRIDAGELPIDGEPLDAGREGEREVAGVLHRGITGERQRARLVDGAAAHELARPACVLLEHRPRHAAQTGRHLVAGRAAPKQAPEAVEAVVPIVVARQPEQHPALAVFGQLRQDLVPGQYDPIQDLAGGGDRVGRVATETQNVAARREQELAGTIGIGQLVGREQQARHRSTHGRVVARVGDEVDEDVAPERSRQAARARRAGVCSHAEHPDDAVEQRLGLVRRHPVARIHVLGGDRSGDEMPKVSPERARPEPDDAAGMLLAAREATHEPCRYRPGTGDTPRFVHHGLDPSRHCCS
jgi:hypothetical protein